MRWNLTFINGITINMPRRILKAQNTQGWIYIAFVICTSLIQKYVFVECYIILIMCLNH